MSSKASPTVADLVGVTLAELGVGHCFGVVGSGNFAVTNSLRAAGVPFTSARHEGGAATMADAFARMSDQVALVSLHQGCGLTNAATGITEAAKSRTPVIVLTAESTAGQVTSNFAMDQPGFVRSMGATSERLHSAATAVADVVRAYATAKTQRRTVVLNLPLDVQAQPAVADVPQISGIPLSSTPARPDPAMVAQLADHVARAERPVIIAGRGARAAGPELRALADRMGALVATSAVANGLFEGDPFNLGISGGFSTPLAAELIADADLIVGFGCALNMWTMRHGRLIGEHATVVQVDDEQAALGAHRPIALGVRGDAALTAQDLLDELARRHQPRTTYRTREIAERIRTESRWNDVPTPDLSTDERIDPRVFSAGLDARLPVERIVSIDSGNFMGYPSQYLRVPDEFGFCFTQAFQSVGLGLGTAIGAALARPDRLPVLGTGDGGFLMAISELETAVRLRLPLVIAVYNDAAYGAEVHHFGVDDDSVDLTTVTFPDTDIAAIARGYGATGVTVRHVEDLALIDGWLAGPRTAPLVIDAKIASDGGAWWLQEAFAGH